MTNVDVVFIYLFIVFFLSLVFDLHVDALARAVLDLQGILQTIFMCSI